MDENTRVKGDAKQIAIVAILFTSTALKATLAHAFNPATHEQITRSAFQYMNSHTTTLPSTRRWLNLGGGAGGVMEELLIRTTVDADFKMDLWLDGWFHDPFVGGAQNGEFTVFTSMLHYLNITTKGDYWDYDGYAYRHSSKKGNDSYLDLPSATVRGEKSRALGGQNGGHPPHGIEPGTYRDGFKGNDHDWHELFFGSNDADDAVFPPADVVAQMNYNAMVKSTVSAETYTESWNDTLPLTTGIFSTQYYSRHYWRAQVAGFPKAFDLLGITLHMAQDMCVPHHALGTAEYCHQELENLIDSMACGTSKSIDLSPYYHGEFGGNSPDCQALFDPKQVEQLLDYWQALKLNTGTTIQERLRDLARISARWVWGEPENDAYYYMATRLPDGTLYRGDQCSDFLKLAKVRDQMKYQYNLAVAATIVVFESAARESAAMEEKREQFKKDGVRYLPLFLGLIGR